MEGVLWCTYMLSNLAFAFEAGLASAFISKGSFGGQVHTMEPTRTNTIIWPVSLSLSIVFCIFSIFGYWLLRRKYGCWVYVFWSLIWNLWSFKQMSSSEWLMKCWQGRSYPFDLMRIKIVELFECLNCSINRAGLVLSFLEKSWCYYR